MHKTLYLLFWRTQPRLEVSCGKWKDDRTAVFIEVVVSDGKKEKVCMIYISSHKDGKARWIMVNCVQAKNWKTALVDIRKHICVLAEIIEFSKSHEQGDPSNMDTTDDSKSASSHFSEDVD